MKLSLFYGTKQLSYKQHANPPKQWLITALILLACGLIYLWHSHPLRTHTKTQVAHVQQIPWQQYIVQPGDSLSNILSKYNVNYSTTLKILKLQHSKNLISLSPGDVINLQLQNNKLLQLHMPISNRKSLSIYLQNNIYHSKTITNPIQITTQFAEGKIQSSLAQSFYKQKIPTRLLSRFEKIFGWKVNFKRDLRKGAQFAIIYEQEKTTGLHQKKHTALGPIILAQLNNNGKTITALRYTTKNGKTDYYDPAGNSLSGRFLKAPLHYTRVSSPFTLRRWHPILHEYRPHFGVDLAAPMKTPIRAAADGRIALRRNVKGYGRTIYIRHNFEYSTRYAHLHAYAKGIKLNSRVKKGEIIGYVGMSGLATGPHLHYEIRKFGIPRNPMTLKLPSADPIPARERKDFFAFARNRIAALQNDKTRYALKQSNSDKKGHQQHG